MFPNSSTSAVSSNSTQPGFFRRFWDWSGIGKPYMPATTSMAPGPGVAAPTPARTPSLGSFASPLQTATPGAFKPAPRPMTKTPIVKASGATAPTSLGQYQGTDIQPGQDVGSQLATVDAQRNGGVLSQYGIQPPSNVGSVNFGVTPTNTVDSTHLNNTSLNDAQAAYMQQSNNFQSGKSQATPTDKYMQQLLGASTYTPQEQDALQNYSDVTGRINAATLAERRQISALQENGSITQDQAKAFIQESQRQSDKQLADLAVQQQGASLSLGVLGQIRGNNVQALQNLMPFYQPRELSPGSTLVSGQGDVLGQGMGASPQTVISTAQTLAQQAMQYGTPQLDQNGQLDMNYYVQQAQSLYQGMGQGGFPGMGGMNGAQQGAPQQGPVQQGFGGGVQALPPYLQSYADQSSIGDNHLAYFNEDRIPASLRPAAMVAARQAGIPYLSNNDVQGVQAVQVIYDALDQATALASQTLKGGITGRAYDSLRNWANNYLQFNPQLANFGVLRDTAAKSVTALAGGVGSGLRLNTAEIATAVNNMPTANDNLETAMTKVQALRTLLQNQLSTKFPQVQSGNLLSGGQQGTGSTGGSLWSF